MIIWNSSATPKSGLTVRHWLTQACVLTLIICLVTSIPWAVADEDRKIITTTEGVAPLRDLLAQMHESYPGQILKVELEEEEYDKEPVLIYEVKLLTAKGNVLKLQYNAISLELLKIKGKPER